MEEDRNRALVRRWFEEVWNLGREATIEEIVAPGAVIHGLGETGRQLRGPEGFRSFYKHFRSAFSDLRVDVQDLLADGDKAVARLSFTGKHTGDSLGIAPTGRSFTSSAIVILKFRDGKITDGWNEFDAAGMMQQLQSPQATMKMRA